jgi:16S rRNA (guanine527-N7)-methyltransferase
MENKSVKNIFKRELIKHSCINDAEIKLLKFCDYIKKSNKLYNLTSIKEIEDMLIKHVLDSLSIKKFIKGNNILDIGTGAGLPGIPLAITLPDYKFSLLDSNNKKIIFLNHVKINLNIINIDLLHKRIESLDSNNLFDTVVCRSYASLVKIYSNSSKHLNKDGIIVAMKGKFPKEEINELEGLKEDIVINIERLNVAGLSADRHAVIIQKKQ